MDKDQEPKLAGAPKEARDPQIIIVREKADGADYKLIAIVALLLASPVILFFGLPFMAVAFVTMETWLPFFLVGLLAVSLVPIFRERLNNQVLVKDLEGRIKKLEAELSEARHALILLDEANEFHSKLQLEAKKQPERSAQSSLPSKVAEAATQAASESPDDIPTETPTETPKGPPKGPPKEISAHSPGETPSESPSESAS